MEHKDQVKEEAKESLPRRSPVMANRTPRMLHESSFATSVFTSSRGQKRPPGFVASSLDFKSSANGNADAPSTVTTKPGKNKKTDENVKQEQLEREKKNQRQKQFRSGHRTRARGNFGPPPHTVKSLEDLENMSEEEIYKLFMDDPKLHQSFIKATEKGGYTGSNFPSSAPVGARKGRRSGGRKPSNQSKSKRSSTKSKTMKPRYDEREFPYFQWSLLFILFGAIIYKTRKAYSIPPTTKSINGVSKNAIGRKRKKKKGGKPVDENPAKSAIVQADVNPIVPVEAKEKRSPIKRKRKKKTAKLTPKSVSSGREKEIKPAENVDHRQEPDLDSTDESSRDNKPDETKQDLVLMEPELAPFPSKNENDEEWQTVTRSSRGEKKERAVVDSDTSEENGSMEKSVVNNIEKNAVIFEPKKEAIEPLDKGSSIEDIAKKGKRETKKESVAAPEEEKNNVELIPTTSGIISEDEHAAQKSEIAPEVEHSGISVVETKEKSTATMEDDAALALRLHEEEVNLARATNGNPQEEAWEEVTTKKKKAF